VAGTPLHRCRLTTTRATPGGAEPRMHHAALDAVPGWAACYGGPRDPPRASVRDTGSKASL
jgi:hypothetical protein